MTIRLVICNAFSLSMLPDNTQGMDLFVSEKIDAAGARAVIERSNKINGEIETAVGHESTAALFSAQLQRKVEVRRVKITLDEHTILLVGQYLGPRLQEGATKLPEGARIEWYTVSAKYHYWHDSIRGGAS